MRSLWQKVKIFLLIHLKIMLNPVKTVIRIDPPRFRLPPTQQMHAPPMASCTTPFLEKRLTLTVQLLVVALILMHLYKIRLWPSNCHLLQQTRWVKQHGAACNRPAWLFHKNLCLSFHTSFIKSRIIASDRESLLMIGPLIKSRIEQNSSCSCLSRTSSCASSQPDQPSSSFNPAMVVDRL